MGVGILSMGVAGVLVVLILYILLVIFMNRTRPLGNRARILKQPANLSDQFGDNLSVTIWNIGYAGLGKDSDFVMDGGKHWFPPSRASVKNNLEGINASLARFLKRDGERIFMLQEVSDKSPLSYWVSVRKKVLSGFEDYMAFFRPDISSWGLPWPFRICHGTLTLCPIIPSDIEVLRIPAEPTYLGGLIKRNYALLVSRYKIKNSSAHWVIVNLHLAAFDPEGATRHKQMDAVFAYAQDEYAKGNYVLLGGDWNLALCKNSFAHTTDLTHLFWLFDLPRKKIPQYWQVACDPQVPSVRTNFQPYIAGQNYTAIIDGFIVSPNVQINDVQTLDTKFEHTDHMPVTGQFSTKPDLSG